MDRYNVIGYKESTPYGVAIRKVECSIDMTEEWKLFLEGKGYAIQYIVLRYRQGKENRNEKVCGQFKGR